MADVTVRIVNFKYGEIVMDSERKKELLKTTAGAYVIITNNKIQSKKKG